MLYLIAFILVLLLIAFAFGAEAARLILRGTLVLAGLAAATFVIAVVVQLSKPEPTLTKAAFDPDAYLATPAPKARASSRGMFDDLPDIKR